MRSGCCAGLAVVVGLLTARAAPPPPAAPPVMLRATGVGHAGRLACGVFTPDGLCFVTAGEDRTIRVWNVADGKELFVLRGQRAAINALALAGHNLLFSGGEDGGLLVWDLSRRKLLSQLPRHEQSIHALAVSRDGKLLASGGGTWNKPLPGELRLWDVGKCALLARLEGHRGQVLGLAFAPDGRALAATDRSGDVKVWDVATRKATTFHEKNMPWSAQYSPDGKWLALGEAWGQIQIFDAATLSEDSVTRAHKGGVFSLAYAPGGRMLASAGYDGTIRLWNAFALEDQPPVTVGSQRGIIWTVAFSPDGRTLASGGAAGQVTFWSISPALAPRFQAPVEPVAGVQADAARAGPPRVALVAAADVSARGVQDLVLARLTSAPDIILLERSAVDRLLREQALSLSGLVDASTAVRAGKILSVDLLAVIEPSRVKGQNSGVVVFDAATGVQLIDSGFTGASLEPQALQVASAVHDAVARWHAPRKDLKTLCFLPVRNADLPPGMDRFCDALATTLERELLASNSAVVLERKRLDRVNEEKVLTPDAATRELLSSVVLVAMDVGRARAGTGIRATVTLRDNAGKELHRITREVADPNGVGLLQSLARAIRAALRTTPLNARASRNRESRRFLRDAQLLWNHKLYAQGLHAAEAAFALKAGEDARMLLTEYLLSYATDMIHPGGMRSVAWGKLEYPISPERLREALGLARRALLLIDTARAALPDPNDQYELWRSVEPFGVTDAQRIFFNKLPYVKVAPPDPEAEREYQDFRRFCLQRLVDRCAEAARNADRGPKALTRYTVAITAAVENVSRLAPSPVAYTKAEAGLAQRWLELAAHYPPNEIPVDTAASFGQFLGKVSEQPLMPGPALPEARAIALDLLERAAHFPSPLVRFPAAHYQLRLLFKAGRLSREEALARHRAMLEEGKHLIDEPPAKPPNPFRAAMYHVLGNAIGTLYLHTRGNSVVEEYLDLCEFMLDRGDVVEDVIRAAVNYGSPERDLNLRVLHVIDRAVQLTDSPQRRLFDGSPERFKDHEMKPARHKILTRLPDLLKLELPWQSVNMLASSKDLQAARLLRAVVHDGHIYLFAGGVDPASRHWLLQLAQVSSLGGPSRVLAKVDVKTDELADAPRSHSFWITPEAFVTSTVLDRSHLYAGTVWDGILAFPLIGGPPRRIGEKDGLPARHVTKLVLVGKTLVAALEGGYLVSYDLDHGRLETIASSRRREKQSPFDDAGPFRVDGLAADPVRQRVLFTLDLSSDKDPRAGIWEYHLAKRQFKRLLPPLAARWSVPAAGKIYLYRPDGLLVYDLAEDQVLLLYGKAPAELTAVKTATMPVAQWITFPGWTFYPGRLLHDGYLWQSFPFQRRTLAGDKQTLLPSLLDNKWDYPFSADVALQALCPDELVIGNYVGLYLVRLKGDRRE